MSWETTRRQPMEEKEGIRMEAEKLIEQERIKYGLKTDEKWEPNLPSYPKLSKEALRGVAGEFVSLACENSEADPAAVLATFLVCWGVEIGRGPYVQVGDAEHRAIENAVIVGASSKSRKGTSARPVEKLFENMESIENRTPCKISPGPLSTGEGLIHAVRDEQQEWKINKDGRGHWITKDPGVPDKRLLVLDEEFAAALACTKREGNTLSAIIRRLFDKGDVEPLTKTSKCKTTGAHVGIVTHITGDELAKALAENEMLNGFGNRFLWLCARRQRLVPFPEPMALDQVLNIREKIGRAIEKAIPNRRYKLNAEAKDLWKHAYLGLSTDHPGLVGCLVNRAEAHVIRLSLLYATLDGAADIQKTHLESAQSLWAYAKQSTQFIFGCRESDPVSAKIIEALKTGPKSSTDLFDATGRNYSKGRMDIAINNLIASGRIDHREERPGKGRPKVIFVLKELNEVNELNDSTGFEQGLSSLNSFDSCKSEKENERFEVRI
jgi:hypothetical protein